MRYREIHPQPPLSDFIECFWTLESESVSGPVQTERILPDGCAELILNFGVEFEQHNDDGKNELQPRHFLVGQMTGPILISPTGQVELIGIRFHPGGTAPFFRVSMQEITDRVVGFGAIASQLERHLLNAIDHMSLLSEKIAALEKLLTTELQRRPHGSWITTVAARIVAQGGLVSVDQLASEAGISGRQLERRFLREVGVGPKLLCRILRFQQVFRAFERNDMSWAPLAVECGYYDQAHLIRDFRQFARQTPAVLFAGQSTLTESFTRKDRTSNFSNTLF
jgi:AraC-like DNA-binding protein